MIADGKGVFRAESAIELGSCCFRFPQAQNSPLVPLLSDSAGRPNAGEQLSRHRVFGAGVAVSANLRTKAPQYTPARRPISWEFGGLNQGTIELFAFPRRLKIAQRPKYIYVHHPKNFLAFLTLLHHTLSLAKG
jgi:hypothetical protein